MIGGKSLLVTSFHFLFMIDFFGWGVGRGFEGESKHISTVS